MKILVAHDSYKDGLTARDSAKAIADGLRRALPHAELAQWEMEVKAPLVPC